MTDAASVHILVVDDEAQVRTLLRARFEKEGFKVSEAANGDEMRVRLNEGAVSLVTLDLTLGPHLRPGQAIIGVTKGLEAAPNGDLARRHRPSVGPPSPGGHF